MTSPEKPWRRLLRALPMLAVLAVMFSALYLVSSVEQETTQLGRQAQWVFLITGVALAVLSVVILARLARLFQRLRAGEPGARLAARLVGLFTALALPPLFVLYLFSVQFLSDTVDGWLDVDTEAALADSITLGQLFLDLRTREVSGQLGRLERQLLLDDDDRLFRDLLRQVSAAGPTELAVMDRTGRSQVMASIDPGQLLADRPSSFAISQALESGQYAAAEAEGGSIRIRVLRRLENPGLGAEPLLLQAIYPLPDEFAALAGRIESAYYRYLNVTFLRERLQQSLMLILTLVLLLTALLAMLLAFNAARRLTRPIRELAVATEELTAGRFPSELSVASRDELGFLVKSFNTMTRELLSGRQALESQRRYLEIVLGRLSAGVMVLDQDGCLSAFNESAGSILGLEEAGDRGASMAELQAHKPWLIPLLAMVQRRQEGAMADWREEIQLGEPDRPLVLVCRGSRLPAATGGQVVVFDDVTVLDQAQRDAAWAEVARRLAHEVKNPLTPIQLAAERLQYKLEPALDDEQLVLLSKATTTIRAQVDTLKRLVDAFGDYARPVRLKLEPLKLDRLVAEMSDLYASGAQAVDFECHQAEGTPPVLADVAQLRQVMLNLIRNAQEAAAGRRLKLTIDLSPEARDQQDGALLVMVDNGPGFANEVLERTFEPYVTTKPRGTGLGLAIVRRIIEDHGGTISVANRPGEGAELRIWLPAAGMSGRA